jgi:SAM-dependent methyltransferase
MRSLSKVCDVADWFDPELAGVIESELQEFPRFHRMQWEFAVLFLALRRHGLLGEERTGLSMGAGRERLLYSVARRVRKLVVADLYDPQTTWESARTDDPEAFIRSGKPFPVDDARLQAVRMDMRELDFADRSFDFCYSACAVEHIGDREDFVRHLQQVHRVLKEGGLYAFTTEFHYGPEVIPHPHNYVFSADYLNELFAASEFVVEGECDAGIARHKANFPRPDSLQRLAFRGPGHLSAAMLDEVPHLQLLRGQCPHTSALFVLRKEGRSTGRRPVAFKGLEASQKFLAEGVAEYRRLLERSEVTLNPFAFGLSSGRADGGRRVSADDPAARTLFHTDYVWLGGGERRLGAVFDVASRTQDDSAFELRVHRYRTVGTAEAECEKSVEVPIPASGRIECGLDVTVDDRCCYAVLAHMVRGGCDLGRIETTSRPLRAISI